MTNGGVRVGRPLTVHHREEVMGTIVTIDAYDEDGIEPDEFLPFLKRAVATLHHVDKVFSTWKADSPLSRLRRGEIVLGEAPLEITDVLERCKAVKELTGGWFDPWALTGGVDPTGFVKGWAAQCAVDELVGSGVNGAIVNAAGDIATFGGPTVNTAFRVGIVNPSSPTTLACTVELRGGIATSGTYERGEHLLDPFSGRFETRFESASVTGPDLGLADALATALVVGGEEVLALIEQVGGYEAMAINLDGGMLWTTKFPFVD